jgi:hypothetical protein
MVHSRGIIVEKPGVMAQPPLKVIGIIGSNKEVIKG